MKNWCGERKESTKHEKDIDPCGARQLEPPLYRDENGRIWVDVEPRSNYAPCLCTITDAGEPCDPMRPDIEVEFVPRRDVWY